MTALDKFRLHFDACPLVAIIRGVTPDECEDIGAALVDAGFRIIEIPLNSPGALMSIERLATRFGDRVLIGAGTVLTAPQVAQVADAGGQIIVSPNTDRHVIEATCVAGLISAPGFFTPSEAFQAIAAGANALKLFPAEAAGPEVVTALRAVVPAAIPLLAVGGIKPQSMAAYLAAGADGFGLGGALYSPGHTANQVAENAKAFMAVLATARVR